MLPPGCCKEVLGALVSVRDSEVYGSYRRVQGDVVFGELHGIGRVSCGILSVLSLGIAPEC